jgi:putative transposase
LDPFSVVVLAIARWMSGHQQQVIAYLVEENRVLREQIGNRRLMFNDDQRRRLAAKAKKLERKALEQLATIATPETLLTWHRNLIAGKHTVGPRRPRGRPATRTDIAALAVRMAEENRSWGYRRIQGALANLGHDLAHNTVRNILKRHGIEPALERVKKTTWKEFLQRHWEQIVASDFFSMDVSKRSRLVSLVMFWFMKVSAHRLYTARTARETDEMSRIRGVGKEVHIADMRALHERRRNRVVADGYVRARCRYRTEPRVGELENRLILPLASNQGKVNQHQSRDRLNDNECEAA